MVAVPDLGICNTQLSHQKKSLREKKHKDSERRNLGAYECAELYQGLYGNRSFPSISRFQELGSRLLKASLFGLPFSRPMGLVDGKILR